MTEHHPDQADYPGWDDDLPDPFTPEWIGSQPVARLSSIERHLAELTPTQQESYRAGVRSFLEPAIEVGRKALAINLPPVKVSTLNPELQAAIARLNERLANQLNVAEVLAQLPKTQTIHIDLPKTPAAKPPTQTVGPTGIESTTQFGTPTVIQTPPPGPVGAPTPSTPTGPVGATGADLSNSITTTADDATALKTLVDIAQKTNDRTEDEKLITGLVAFAVIVAGVAPITAADSWTERFWTIGVSVVLWAVAFGTYLWRKRKRSTQE